MTGQIIHATAVAINGNGVLLVGASGSGKSDLALRLIDSGATLVSDDAVAVTVSAMGPMLSVAPNIEGRIEVRGVGICTIEYIASAPLRLIAMLTDNVERMPHSDFSEDICGFDAPLINVSAFESSAALKVTYALRCIVDADRWPMPKQTTRQSEGSQF